MEEDEGKGEGGGDGGEGGEAKESEDYEQLNHLKVIYMKSTVMYIPVI